MPSLDLGKLIQRLSGDLVIALEEAVAIAVRHGHGSVEMEHWFLGMDARMDNFAPILTQCGCDVERVRDAAAQSMERYARGHSEAPSISPTVIDVIREAWVYASLQHGRASLDLLDLLYVMVTDSTLRTFAVGAVPALRDLRVGELERLLDERPQGPAMADSPISAQGQAVGSGASGESCLAAYTIDMTALAEEGRIDPVIGRDEELRQLIDILVRRRQNNPILVGEAGVGKTAVAEALAMEIANGSVPDSLADVRLLSLDLTLLQAGAGVKGEFERRLKGVIDEVKASAFPIILFIDEAHTLVGAGGAQGQGDAANILKPALARGEVRTVAATTWAEYKKYFEKDAALTRRFQPVQVNEPDEETAVQMVRSLVPVLEKHHGVRIRDAAVRAAVGLSMRYIQARQLPDKAISLIDTACAAVSISRAMKPARIDTLERQRDLLMLERSRLEAEPDKEASGERIAELDTKLADLADELESLAARYDSEKALAEQADTAEGADVKQAADVLELERQLLELQGEQPLVHRVVDKETVAAVVARWTGIPLGRLMRDLVETVQMLETRLKERVIGQDRALKAIADAMVTARANLSDERRPPGVFLMVGTSGVGKTETALALASLLYGGEDNLTVINMSEFKEEHKVSLLLGSPPGYVGYGEGGILTEAVRRRPYGALLLDEIDKAHPGVQDIFYQVFDKGMLKDGEGRDIDFKNTTIMMTANTGTNTLRALAADPETMPEGDALVEMLQPELLEQFKPAFLGRVNILPFMPLDADTMAGIIRLQLGRIEKRLANNHKCTLVVPDAVVTGLVERAANIETGARAIEAIISREILPSISRQLLELTMSGKSPGNVDLQTSENGRIVVAVT